MTSTLLILGDSLMDAGNVSRATDGLVLGEQIAFEMGGDQEVVQLFPLEDLPRPAPARRSCTTMPREELSQGSELNNRCGPFVNRLRSISR